jgi:hypothetical protein
MGRPPIGKVAMTDAERQRKRRALLAAQLPEWTPGYSDTDWRHNKFVEHLTDWLQYGDVDQVTELLTEIGCTAGRWEEVSQKVTARLAELEREAIAEDEARQAWLREHPEEARAEEEAREASIARSAGITVEQSREWQALAKMPEEEFEELIVKSKTSGDSVTPPHHETLEWSGATPRARASGGWYTIYDVHDAAAMKVVGYRALYAADGETPRFVREDAVDTVEEAKAIAQKHYAMNT